MDGPWHLFDRHGERFLALAGKEEVTAMKPEAYEAKIADLERDLAQSKSEALRAASWANGTMDLLDRVLEECDGVSDIGERIAKARRQRGGILLPRPCLYLAKHGIARFSP